MVLQAARRWLTPAPDSAAADSLRCGRSPWMHAVHLLWSAWLFITPSFGGPGYTPTWFALTALSFPIFLALYAGSVLHSKRLATSHALGMVALGDCGFFAALQPDADSNDRRTCRKAPVDGEIYRG